MSFAVIASQRRISRPIGTMADQMQRLSLGTKAFTMSSLRDGERRDVALASG